MEKILVRDKAHIKRTIMYVMEENVIKEKYAIHDENPTIARPMYLTGKTNLTVYEDKKGKYVKLYPNYKYYLMED